MEEKKQSKIEPALMAPTLLGIPSEALLHILGFLNRESKKSLFWVNKALHNLSQDNSLWKDDVLKFLATPIERKILEDFCQYHQVSYYQLYYKILRFRRYGKSILEKYGLVPDIIDAIDIISTSVNSKVFDENKTFEEKTFRFLSEQELNPLDKQKHLSLSTICLLTGNIGEDLAKSISSDIKTLENARLIMIFSRERRVVLTILNPQKEGEDEILKKYLIAAALSGSFFIFKEILEHYSSNRNSSEKELKKLLISEDFNAVWEAVISSGDSELLDYYLEYFDGKYFHSLNFVRDRRTVKKILEKSEFKDVLKREIYLINLLYEIVKTGNNDLLEFFIEQYFSERELREFFGKRKKYPILNEYIRYDDWEYLRQGILNGLNIKHSRLCYEIFLSEISANIKKGEITRYLLLSASEIDNEELFDFFLKEIPDDEANLENYNEILISLIRKGNIKFLQKIARKHPAFGVISFGDIKFSPFPSRQPQSLLDRALNGSKRNYNFFLFKILLEKEEGAVLSSIKPKYFKRFLEKTTQLELAYHLIDHIQRESEPEEADNQQKAHLSEIENYRTILFINIVERKIPRLILAFLERYPDFDIHKAIFEKNIPPSFSLERENMIALLSNEELAQETVEILLELVTGKKSSVTQKVQDVNEDIIVLEDDRDNDEHQETPEDVNSSEEFAEDEGDRNKQNITKSLIDRNPFSGSEEENDDQASTSKIQRTPARNGLSLPTRFTRSQKTSLKQSLLNRFSSFENRMMVIILGLLAVFLMWTGVISAGWDSSLAFGIYGTLIFFQVIAWVIYLFELTPRKFIAIFDACCRWIDRLLDEEYQLPNDIEMQTLTILDSNQIEEVVNEKDETEEDEENRDDEGKGVDLIPKRKRREKGKEEETNELLDSLENGEDEGYESPTHSG